MADQAGLQSQRSALPAQAGLSMADVTRQFHANIARGMTPAEARADISFRSGVPVTPETADRPVNPASVAGLAVTGARQVAQDIVMGAARQIGVEDYAEPVGDFLGPSARQEEAAMLRAQNRADAVAAGEASETGAFIADVGDAVVQSSPQIAASIAGAAVGGRAADGLTRRAIDNVFGRMRATRPLARALRTMVRAGGALGGALAISQPQLYESGYRKAEEEGLDLDDEGVRERVALRANVGAAIEAIVPTAIVNRVLGGGLSDTVQRGVLAGAARVGARDAVGEGLTEALDFSLEQILLDPKIYDSLSDGDKREVFDYFVERYSRDFAISALSGGVLGGGAGAGSGAAAQSARNAAITTDLRRVLEQSRDLGADDEMLAAMARTPDGVRKLRQSAEALGRANMARFASLRALNVPSPNEDASGSAAQIREAAKQDIEADYERAVDSVAQELGLPMRMSDVKRIRAEREEAVRTSAIDRLMAVGRKAPDDMPTARIASIAASIETARSAYERARDRVEAIADPARRAEAIAERDAAEADLREAEVRADMELQGKSADEVSDAAKVEVQRQAQAQRREAAIARQMALEFPEGMPEAERLAKAREIVAEAEADPEGSDRGLRAKIGRLARKRRAAEDEAEIDRLTNEIAELEARRGLPTPAVEAARRVLQAQATQSPSGPTDIGPDARTKEGGEEPSSDAPLSQYQQTFRQVLDEELGWENLLPDGSPERDAVLEAAARNYGRDGKEFDLEDALADWGGNIRAALRRLDDLAIAGTDARSYIVDIMTEPRQNGETFQQLLDRVAPLVTQEFEAAASDILEVSRLPIQERMASQDITPLMDGRKGLDDIEARMGEIMAQTGHEVAAFVTADGDLVAAMTDGHANQVTIPRVHQKDRTLIFTHTHTAQTPFSMSDVSSMMKTKQVFRAVLPDGQVIEMKPTGRLTEAEAQSLYSLVADDIERRALRDDARGRLPFTWTMDQRARLRQEAMLRALNAAGAIEYSRPLKGLTDAEKGYLDAAAERARGHIDDLRARADGRDRLAAARKEGGGLGADRAGNAIPASEIAERVTPRSRPGANPERVRAIAADIYRHALTDYQRQGRKPYIVDDILNRGEGRFAGRDPNSPDRMTEERLAEGVAAAAEQIGNKVTYAVHHVAKALYPNYDWKSIPLTKHFAEDKDGGLKATGKFEVAQGDPARGMLNSALWLILAVENAGKGAFYLQQQQVRNKRTGGTFKTQWLKATDDLIDYLEFTVPERARLYPALETPDDTSEVLRSNESQAFVDEESGDVEVESDSGDNLFTTYALEPARRTARYLQQNRYGIDMARLNALQPDDMISDKGMAGDGHPNKADALAYYRSYVDAWSAGKLKVGSPEQKWMDAHAARISERLEQAATDLQFLRRTVAQYRREHGDKPVGFVYQVDDKGRIYANGAFTPQTIDGVKSIFTVDGVSLADMETIDASASGWQVAALMARDHVAAPNVNLGEGSGLTPGSPKRDLYTDVITDVRARIEADALNPNSPRYEQARVIWNIAFGKRSATEPLTGAALDQAILNNQGDPKPLVNRKTIKRSTIAVNYGAPAGKFTEDFQRSLGERAIALYGRQTPVAGMWGYLGSSTYEGLRRKAPHTLAYQEWALDALEALIKAVEQRAPRSSALLRFSVGLEGTYQRKRHRRVDLVLRPRAPNGYYLQRGDGGKILRAKDGRPLISPRREMQAEHTVKYSLLDQVDARGTARSIWSQRVQGFDASILHRAVERYKTATNGAFVTTNHDSFTVPKEYVGQMASAVRESMKEIMGQVDDPARLYEEIISQADLYGVGDEIRKKVKPFDNMGEYGLDTLDTSSPVFREAEDGDVSPEFAPLPDDGALLARARDVDVAGYIEALPEAGKTYGAITESIRSPVKSSRRLLELLEDGYLNRFAPIRRLEVSVKGTLGQGFDSAFKSAEMAVNDSGRNEMLLYMGAAARDANGGVTVAPGTVGIYDILRTAGGDGPAEVRGQRLQNWMQWMYARQAAEYVSRGIKVPQTPEEIADALAKEEPNFRLAADQWAAHNRANLEFAYQSGRLSAAQRDALQANTLYVPFYRAEERIDGASPVFELPAAGIGKPGDLLARDPGIRKILGGDKQKLQNLITNMIQNSQAIVAASMRNDAANKAFDLLEMSGMAKVVPISAKKPTPNAVRMWKGGVEQWLVPTTNDAEPVMLAVAGLTPAQMNMVMKIMTGISSVFRQGITIGFPFILRNWFRGATAAGLLTSGANMTYGSNTLTGVVEAWRNGPLTQAFKARSGMGDYRFGGRDVGFGKNDIFIDFGLVGKGADLRTVGYQWRKILAQVERLGMSTELADRVAAYKTMIARGVREDEAAYQALTIINYNRRGGSSIAQFLLPTLPFLNARLQGWVRLAEGAISRDATPQTRARALLRLATNISIYTAITIAAHGMLLADEEDREVYESEPLHRKLNYHSFYIDGTAYYLPKPFELGFIGGSLPQLLLDAAFTDSKDLGPGVAKMLADTFLFNVIPQGFMPFVEASANYNFFTQAPIEGRRERSLQVQDRITNASPLSVFIGRQMGLSNVTNVSPAMMEHFFQSFGGAFYTIMQAGFATLAGDLGLAEVQPTAPFPDTPFIGPFLQQSLGWAAKDIELMGTRWVEDYYRAAETVEQAYNSMRDAALTGRLDAVQQIASDNPQIVAQARLARRVTMELGQIQARVRAVRLDRSLSREEKTDQLRKLYRARNELARQAAQILQRVSEIQAR